MKIINSFTLSFSFFLSLSLAMQLKKSVLADFTIVLIYFNQNSLFAGSIFEVLRSDLTLSFNFILGGARDSFPSGICFKGTLKSRLTSYLLMCSAHLFLLLYLLIFLMMYPFSSKFFFLIVYLLEEFSGFAQFQLFKKLYLFLLFNILLAALYICVFSFLSFKA